MEGIYPRTPAANPHAITMFPQLAAGKSRYYRCTATLQNYCQHSSSDAALCTALRACVAYKLQWNDRIQEGFVAALPICLVGSPSCIARSLAVVSQT